VQIPRLRSGWQRGAHPQDQGVRVADSDPL